MNVWTMTTGNDYRQPVLVGLNNVNPAKTVTRSDTVANIS